MISHNDVKSRLLAELTKRNILCNGEEHKSTEKKIDTLGKEYTALFLSDKVIADWQQLIELYPSNCAEKELNYIVGKGAVITEFLIAPLNLSDKKQQKAIYLGTLLNLIVTCFDSFVDDKNLGFSWVDAYSDFLKKALKGDVQITKFDEPHYIVMCALSTAYIKLIAVNSSHWKLNSLLKHIGQMYRAQLQTIIPNEENSTAFINRKSALPFMIMGMSAWGFTDKSDSFYSKHFRWMHCYGSIIAMIDDFVDIHADKKNECPNIFLLNWKSLTPTTKEFEVFQQCFYRQIEALINGWQIFMQKNHEPNNAPDSILGFSIISWFKQE